MNHLFEFISKRPKKILVAIGIMTGFCILLLSGTEIRTEFRNFVLDKHFNSYEYVRDHFGIYRAQSMTIEAVNGQSVLSLPLLKEQNHLFATIEKRWPVRIESVAGVINKRIYDIQKAKHPNSEPKYNIYDFEEQESIDNLLVGIYMLDPYEVERMMRKALANEGFIDAMQEFRVFSTMFGGSGLMPKLKFKLPTIKATRAGIYLKESMPQVKSQRIFTEIRSFTDTFSPNLKIRHLSTELMSKDQDKRLLTNGPFVIGTIILLLVIVLFHTFRSWFFTLVPIGILILTVVWAFTLISLLGIKQFSFSHVITIPILFGQCIDNIIHFHERFLEEYGRISKKEALKIVFRTAGKAAGLTTMINMAAFTIDYFNVEVVPVKHYALLIVLGIGLAMVLTYLISTSSFMLKKIPIPKPSQAKQNAGIHVKRLFSFLHRNHFVVLFVAFGMLAFMLSNCFKIDTSFRIKSYLGKNFPTYNAHEFEKENFKLFMPHFILLKGNVASEKALNAVKAIEKKLDSIENVEHIHNRPNTESLTYLLDKFDPKSLPDSLTETYKKLAESNVIINPILGLTASDMFPRIVEEKDGKYLATTIKFWPSEQNSKSILQLGKDLEESAAPYATPLTDPEVLKSTEADEELVVQVAGELMAFTRTASQALKGFLIPTILTFIFIIVCLWIGFKRFMSIFITVLPTIFGSIFSLGSLYLLGTELNSLNATTGVVAAGLGIDYAIQIMVRYLEELKRNENEIQAMRECLSHMAIPLGKCVLLTSAGLIVLVGVLPVTAHLGIAASIGLLTSYTCAVLILPILATKFVKKLPVTLVRHSEER